MNEGDTKFPPIFTPMVYQAQSPDDIHLRVKLQENSDDFECGAARTFDKKIEMSEDGKKVFVSAICFENEKDIKHYQREIELAGEFIPRESSIEQESEASFHFTLKKKDGPSYWP